ncbi:dicer-like protein 2 [Echria macrotheca]|uniref:Dicer-like protein 2 n=1 Tax=Echria macrotheca TaxID=438768 RepID=A0AAJ0BAB1_9PEZI|nr:dicer-like protein 2 [Echria macrotheca]
MTGPGEEMVIDHEDDWSTCSDSDAEAAQDGPPQDSMVSSAPSEQLEPEASSGESTPAEASPEPPTMTARAYQLEMFELSLKQNIIVAMDTGSGKTHVAVLRIREELGRSDKRVWFLAPTVPLAGQQHDVLRAQIAGIQSRLIRGSDNVEAWSDHATWNEILHNVRVVVSTFQILFDAVSHGFVRLDSLSLIVVDEAHHCIGNNAVARLMREIYWRDKQNGREVPHIMGLTASPLMRNNFKDLETLESTLDAVCRTPTEHRDELMTMVNRPQVHTVRYPDPPSPEGNDLSRATPSLASLTSVFRGLNLLQDPDVIYETAQKTERSRQKLLRIMKTQSTYCRTKFRSFINAAKVMHSQLGSWATNYYIHTVITRFLSTSSARNNRLLEGLSEEASRYLAEAFRIVNAPPPPTVPDVTSPKVETLLQILSSHGKETVGIIFAKDRATVGVLTHLLSVHPLTADRYRVGSVVGSTKPGRDYLDLSRKEDLFSLQEFRVGKTNLLVATSVLEEGIDVPECNLVICFDQPNTPKSFIQRRGRARMSSSHLYLMISESSGRDTDVWKQFEDGMRRMYEDDMQRKQTFEEIERAENPDYPVLEVEETRARLTIDDAKRHLEHFCGTLSSRKFIDPRPYYTIGSLDGRPLSPETRALLKATVHLPTSLVPELRRFTSLQGWYSQEYAMKDAAFHAYSQLYEAGLVNKNLLPVHVSELLPDAVGRAGLAVVSEQLNPWVGISHKWRATDGELFRRRVLFENKYESISAEFHIVLPVPIPHMAPVKIYWDAHSDWTITMDESEERAPRSHQPDHTMALLSMSFGHRQGWVNPEKRHPLRIVSACGDLSMDDMAALDFSPDLMQGAASGHLIRDVEQANQPYIYLGWLPNKPPADMIGRLPRWGPKRQAMDYESAPDVPYVVVRSWPKRAGSFQPVGPKTAEAAGSSKPYPRIHPAAVVRVDRVPAKFTHIGMLIPALTYALETHLVASDLMANHLESLHLSDLSLVLMAISTTSSRGPVNYERVEFLGDSILKFCTTANVSARFLLWPEGYLTQYKDKIVSNSRLFQAAVESGLDRYIITKPYSVQRPFYVEDLINITPTEQMEERRQLATKTPADVIESLIGISYLEGGLQKAVDCMSLLLPDGKMKWQGIERCRQVLYENAPADHRLPTTMGRAEVLIGYTFKKKALLVEALTHGSYNLPGVTACLERLEFLGDAVLDYIVVTALFDIPELQNWHMHRLKTALVNGDILAFLVMEWAVEEERMEVSSSIKSEDEGEEDEETTVVTGKNSKPILTERTMVKHALWSFMRHASGDMGIVQQATQKRYEELRGEIVDALQTGSHYPWAQLAKLQAQKFYSDLFESVLGAVWVDSGSIEACKGVVERVGILPMMRRLLADGVKVLHPKEELSQRALGKKVDYQISVVEVGEDKESREFACRVVLESRVLAEVTGGVTKEEAKTRAAAIACSVLQGEAEGPVGGEWG